MTDREALTRVIPFVEGRHYVVAASGCWEWTGHTLRGYANSSAGKPHRRMYSAVVGPIPAGYDLHHVCRNRLCINPAHMEPRERRIHRAEHQQEDIVWGKRWKEVGGPLGRPPAFCSFCGAELEGMRHKRYCDVACRRSAQTARRRAQRDQYSEQRSNAALTDGALTASERKRGP